MPHVQIIHSTEYTYRHPVVELTRHRLMARPQDSHDLRLHKAILTIDPAPLIAQWAHDVSLVAGDHLIWVGVARSTEQAFPVVGGFVGDPTAALGLTVNVRVLSVPDKQVLPINTPSTNAALPI